MTDKKQIEEMARDLENHTCMSQFQAEIASRMLYKVGYRKQEWISVDEKLPDEDIRVLVYINSDRSYTNIDTDRFSKGTWVRWYKDVTHWMPLPEPPKGE